MTEINEKWTVVYRDGKERIQSRMDGWVIEHPTQEIIRLPPATFRAWQDTWTKWQNQEHLRQRSVRRSGSLIGCFLAIIAIAAALLYQSSHETAAITLFILACISTSVLPWLALRWTDKRRAALIHERMRAEEDVLREHVTDDVEVWKIREAGQSGRFVVLPEGVMKASEMPH